MITDSAPFMAVQKDLSGGQTHDHKNNENLRSTANVFKSQ